MTETNSPKREFPDHLPPKIAGDLGDRDIKVYPTKDEPVTIKDIVVFGPILHFYEQGDWTIGMRGFRWATENGSNTSEISPDKAQEFVKNYVSEFRRLAANPPVNATDPTPHETSMDIDIYVPTLIVVVSPTPKLEFDTHAPISGKVYFDPTSEIKFGEIDGNCKHENHKPNLWSFVQPQTPLWDTPGHHILTWFSGWENGKPKKLKSHNYHMNFSSISFNHHGAPHKPGRSLPIIFDPGNNNGGGGGFPPIP